MLFALLLQIVPAGETLTLEADLVLKDGDVLDVQGTPEKRCVLVGNGHAIRGSGRLRLSHTDVRGLGAAPLVEGDKLVKESPAIDVRTSEVEIAGCDFDASGSIVLRVEGAARVVDNLIRESSIVSVNRMVHLTRPAFTATGGSGRFSGNRVYRSNVHVTGAGWRIEDNRVIGLRAGIFAYGEGTVVRGNYVHVLMPRTPEYPWWSQVSTFTTAKGALAEHNVIRDGEWIVRMVEGEFRYNVVCDINDHDLMQNGSVGRVHHNVFIAGRPDHPPGSMFGAIAVIYKGPGIEIWNNTFDGGNVLNVPGVEVNPEAFVKSLRNNAFVRFAHGERYYKGPQAMIRPSWNETLPAANPNRLGYADFNLFHGGRRNYALGVEGKTERKDAGFGLRDVDAEPGFAGPVPERFPFDDADIKAGRVTVAAMLARFREIYAPAAGSPLIDAGDPADGPGADIGAVGAGAAHAEDRFGKP